MPNLPLECIAKVIELVDNRQDLFNLLTVNKNFFLVVVHRLYRDPLKSNTSTSMDNVRKLVLLLLSLSPVSGRDIDIIRQSNGLPPSGTPVSPPPTIDYLSLVKIVGWDDHFYCNNDLLGYLLGQRYKDVYTHLTWAFVGHRLDEIEELEINVKDRERYLINADKMTSLRKIWVRLGKNRCEEMYDFSEAIIKTIQRNHGPSQLSECHMIPHPLVYGPVLFNPDSQRQVFDLKGAQRVLSLLPPLKSYPTLPRPDGSIVTLDHPMDRYVATVQNSWCRGFDSVRNMWNTMTMMHPGHSDGQILQRFRGMTSLHIHPKTANGNDENILDWAVCEAEHFHHQQGNLQFAPLIQLKELSIEYRDNSIASQLRHVIPKWKILQDGLLGFSSTLSRLRVIYPHFGNGMTDLAFTISRPLPKLKSLTLEGFAIDRSVWEQVPNIEEMDIRFEITPSRYNNPLYHSQYLQYDENTGVFSTSPTTVDATTTITTPVPTEQQPQIQLFELWFHCPNLTQLTLKGRAAILLDPNCFHLSPNLQKLEISIWAELSHIAQEAQKPLHPTRWTWDWPFPVLRFLTLEGDLRELMFTMGILCSCPSLKSINLRHCIANRRYPLRVKGILDASMDKNNKQMLPFAHSNLSSIHFLGFWDIKADELVCLLQVLPGLKKLEIGSAHFNEGFGDHELIEITKNHPSLEYVYTYMARTTEPPSALGLLEIGYLDRKVSSNQETTVVEDNHNTPKERTEIVYTFGYDRYILCV